MPEGVEVAVMTERLDVYLKGAKLYSIKFISGKYDKKQPIGYVQLRRYFPIEVARVGSHGKFIYFIFGKGTPKSPRWVMFNSLRLTGEWSFDGNGGTRAILTFEYKNKIPHHVFPNAPNDMRFTPSKYLTLSKSDCNTNTLLLYYNDMINLGTIEFHPDLDLTILKKKIRTLGYDILKNPPTYQEFTNLIENTRNMNICSFLLSQQRLSGIGNYLLQEILYKAKLSPLNKLLDMTPVMIKNLYASILYTVKSAYITQNGIHNYIPRIKPRGKFSYKVYRQKVCPNGDKIKISKVAGKNVHWCPSVQK